MRVLAVLLVIVPGFLSGQPPKGQGALNHYVAYGNQSADEIQRISQAIITYYSAITSRPSSWPRFGCPVQPEEYYYKKAAEEGVALGEKGASVKRAFDELRNSAQRIDLKCKALDTYHKLEDHRKDNYVQGKKLVEEMLVLLEEYHSRQDSFHGELTKYYEANHAPHTYDNAVSDMRRQLDRERKFISLWKYNLNEQVHTAWVEKQLSESILETAAELRKMEEAKPVLKYPASGMWSSFLDGMSSILESKRNALDQYNNEARKSDRHANATYSNLITYYNGVLVANYNTFLDYAANDKFWGLKYIDYVPQLEIRSAQANDEVAITPFKDEEVSLPALTKQSRVIGKNEYAALENYITFINESFRQLSKHRNVVSNLNARTAYVASQSADSRRGSIQFKHDGFSVPLSYYERAVSESKSLPPQIAEALNTRARVLLNILKEMDQIGVSLERQTADKSYEQDACKNLYVHIERTKILYDTWDERKESLYEDIRKVFESFAPTEPNGSWSKSGAALLKLTDLDREALFAAKRYYKNQSTDKPATQRIDDEIRNVLANEYGNMEGIQKYGRSHGLCPYTPYEDLPKSSRSLSEALQELKPARTGQTRYEHPYHMMVYHYNDVVRYLNKFSELSQSPLLKAVFQPELFEVVYPEPTANKPETNAPTRPQVPEPPQVVQNTVPSTENNQPQTTNTITEPEVRVVRDTVYIERRDTVYITENSANLRSMEGYATNNLVLLLDVSGSMNSPEKLPILKESVIQLLEMMREEDQISIVVFSGKPRILLKAVSFQEKERITKAIRQLQPSGNTDANAGIRLAYRVADENYVRGGNNRIILATDGEFGINDESRRLISKFAGQDILLSVFNFGKAKSTTENLKTVAALGNGSYQFISRDNVEINLIREVKARRK